MFLGWNTNGCQAKGSPLKRRDRRCVPTVSGLTSALETRVLLSGTTHHASEVAKSAGNLAETHLGHIVIGLYESILGTAPTSAQLTNWVHKLRGGVSRQVLREDLLATAQADELQASTPSVNLIGVSSDPPAWTLSTTESSPVTLPFPGTSNSSAPTVALYPLTAIYT